MLTLNLTRIRTPFERFDREYAPEQVGEAGDSFRVIAPAMLGFDLHKDKSRYRLAGTVGTTLELTCGRCLDPFTLPVAAAFDLQYQPREESPGAPEREIGDRDFSSALYENETIDLGELMREQFYLAVPMKPLCRPDCQGLCPECGTNWNRGSCTCRRDWEDPRFAALRALKSTTQDQR